MDRNGTALNTLMFIRMSSNIFYPFSTIYPESGDKTVCRPVFQRHERKRVHGESEN